LTTSLIIPIWFLKLLFLATFASEKSKNSLSLFWLCYLKVIEAHFVAKIKNNGINFVSNFVQHKKGYGGKWVAACWNSQKWVMDAKRLGTTGLMC